jgi:hypothetical protein
MFGGKYAGIPVTFHWRPAEPGRDISVVGQWRVRSNPIRLALGNTRGYGGKSNTEQVSEFKAGEELPLIGLHGAAWELPLSSQILSYVVSPPNSPFPIAQAETINRLTVATVPHADDTPIFSFDGFTDSHYWPRPRDKWQSLNILSIDKADLSAPVTETAISPKSYIAAFTVSSDGKQVALATGSEIQIHDAYSGSEVLRLALDNKAPACKLAFNPADDLLAAGFESGDVQVIRMKDQKTLIDEHAHETPITLLRFSPKGTYLVSAGAPPLDEDSKGRTRQRKEAGAAKVWRPNEGQLHFEIPHVRPLDEAVSFNSSESRIAVANHHQQLEIWETTLGTRLLAFRGHCCAPAAVAFNPTDDSMLVSAPNCHSYLYVWSAAESRDVPLEAPH